ITLCPNSPLLLPNPSGHTSVAEFINTQVELNAEAQTKITLAKNSYVSFVSASTISTPFAFWVSLSYKIRVTMEYGRRVRLPVATAAGKVDDCVLKYPPKLQPSQHWFWNWHPGRPSCGTEILAVRLWIKCRLPL